MGVQTPSRGRTKQLVVHFDHYSDGDLKALFHILKKAKKFTSITLALGQGGDAGGEFVNRRCGSSPAACL